MYVLFSQKDRIELKEDEMVRTIAVFTTMLAKHRMMNQYMGVDKSDPGLSQMDYRFGGRATSSMGGAEDGGEGVDEVDGPVGVLKAVRSVVGVVDLQS